MHKAAVWISFSLGLVALIGTLLWLAAGSGSYGSPYGHLRSREDYYSLILVLGGPISLLPAGLLGWWRPRLAGAWLLAGSVFVFFWHLGMIQYDGFGQFFRSNPSLDAWLPIALFCTPMILLGTAFLWPGRAYFVSKFRSPEFRRRLAVVTASIVGIPALGLIVVLLTRPMWTVTVRPEAGSPTSRRFNARECGEIMYGEFPKVFDPLFRNPGPAQRTLLGTYEVSGPKGDDGKSRPVIYECVAERRPGEGLLIFRNGVSIGSDPNDEKALENARFIALRDIYISAAKEHPPWPTLRLRN